MEFKKARVRWFLSINSNLLPQHIKEKNQIDDIERLSQNETQSDARENRKDIEKKKTAEIDKEFQEKKKTTKYIW